MALMVESVWCVGVEWAYQQNEAEGKERRGVEWRWAGSTA